MLREKWQAARATARAKKTARQLGRMLAQARSIGEWAETLHIFVREEQWRGLESSHGTKFADFGECACDASTHGLGARDEKSAKLLKAALLMDGHVNPWIQLLKRIKRPPGRPPNTPAQGEDFIPFYSVSESRAARDRILLDLDERGRTDLLEGISSGRLTAKQAGFEAGILKVDHSRGPACDIPRIRTMSDRAQVKWVGRVYRAMSPEAQATFVERELGPAGKEFAAQWRRRKQSGNN